MRNWEEGRGNGEEGEREWGREEGERKGAEGKGEGSEAQWRGRGWEIRRGRGVVPGKVPHMRVSSHFSLFVSDNSAPLVNPGPAASQSKTPSTAGAGRREGLAGMGEEGEGGRSGGRDG